MNESLQSDLRILLAKHPELKNTSVDFDSDDFLITRKDEDNNTGPVVSKVDEEKTCSISNPGPDIINGHSAKVEIRKSEVHGYGVFAKEGIEKGEQIEELIMLRLGWRRNYHHDPVLKDYLWGDKRCQCDECKIHGNKLYIALGLGSIYNHSDNPNASVLADFEARIQKIKAIRRIEAGEELFVSYGKKYFLIRDFMKSINKDNRLETHLEKNRQPH